uniref:5'-3' exoribonuclease 2 homolog n=1 Tax=Dermatophagoides pteronyssinus TaxID=6956 RepID=A0A6P6XK35_DERPT|nr:5'-3' exoribonuclease 2 homolog [Dermatophagoides pteronyssinus]
MLSFSEVNSRNYTRGFNFIGAYLDRLILTFTPNKLIYIAVDGVAPAAKMIQQRTRRYRKAGELIAKKKIHNHINELLRSKDAREHKILDFIKANRQNKTFYNASHVLFSPDADLILLLLASHVKNILLVREAMSLNYFIIPLRA